MNDLSEWDKEMPFPRNWSEELLAEWLQLEGYVVETGVPIRTPKAGGRYEADIIGYRVKNGKAEIYHIKVGCLAKGRQETINMIEKKFSPENEEAIKSYCKQKFGRSVDMYRQLYIAEAYSNRVYNYAKDEVSLQKLTDFIHKKILPTIQHWKDDPPHKPTVKGKTVTLPDGMWLLKLVDYLRLNIGFKSAKETGQADSSG